MRKKIDESERVEPLKVVVISQFFPPESLGGGHRWQRFINNYEGNEIQFRVICPPPSNPYGEFDRSYRPWQTETIDGIPVTRLWAYQPQSKENKLGRILNYGIFSVMATFYILIHFWRFNCVATMSTPHTTFLPGAIGKLLGRTWVVDIMDLWLDNAAEMGYADENSIGYKVVAKLEEIAMIHADEVAVLTATMAEYYQEKYDISGDKFTAIPFGVDEEMFPPILEDERKPRIIYVGNIGTFYAFEPYFRAFAQLEDQYELYVVGWGERREELEKLCDELDITDRVTFTGSVPREEIPDLLASSSINLVPLRTDYQLDYARPTKLLEGMAVGTPYIASPVKEVEAVTNQSQAGIGVDNDPAEITNAMETILADKDLQIQMGERAIKFIEQEHRWNTLSERMCNVIIDANSDAKIS